MHLNQVFYILFLPVSRVLAAGPKGFYREREKNGQETNINLHYKLYIYRTYSVPFWLQPWLRSRRRINPLGLCAQVAPLHPPVR